jgi:hypothetical protein
MRRIKQHIGMMLEDLKEYRRKYGNRRVRWRELSSQSFLFNMGGNHEN